MAKNSRLLNEFSWSFSRFNTFQECKKRYWYTYYGSWEGWPKTPWDSRPSIDPLASYLYAIKNMQRLPLFIGSCVHETIEKTLKDYMREKNDFPTPDSLVAKAIAHFNLGIEESKAEQWRTSPKKHLNLFEHYYNLPVADSILQEARQKIELCITNWVTSPIIKMLFDTRAHILSVEEMGTFQLADKYKIIVVVDLAIKWKNSNEDIYILFDWKTGQKSKKTDEQLYAYALFASKVWKAPHDNIILSPFYLLSNEYMKLGHRQKEPIAKEKLVQVENEIIASCETMSMPLQDLPLFAGSPPPDPTFFPYTQERNQCTLCPFHEVCQKANYEECSTQQLREIIKTVV